jgi:hypothetical protein
MDASARTSTDSSDMGYRGIEGLKVAEDGSLVVETAFGAFRETKPLIYQDIRGKRIPVDGQFAPTAIQNILSRFGLTAGNLLSSSIRVFCTLPTWSNYSSA